MVMEILKKTTTQATTQAATTTTAAMSVREMARAYALVTQQAAAVQPSNPTDGPAVDTLAAVSVRDLRLRFAGQQGPVDARAAVLPAPRTHLSVARFGVFGGAIYSRVSATKTALAETEEAAGAGVGADDGDVEGGATGRGVATKATPAEATDCDGEKPMDGVEEEAEAGLPVVTVVSACIARLKIYSGCEDDGGDATMDDDATASETDDEPTLEADDEVDNESEAMEMALVTTRPPAAICVTQTQSQRTGTSSAWLSAWAATVWKRTTTWPTTPVSESVQRVILRRAWISKYDASVAKKRELVALWKLGWWLAQQHRMRQMQRMYEHAHRKMRTMAFQFQFPIQWQSLALARPRQRLVVPPALPRDPAAVVPANLRAQQAVENLVHGAAVAPAPVGIEAGGAGDVGVDGKDDEAAAEVEADAEDAKEKEMNDAEGGAAREDAGLVAAVGEVEVAGVGAAPAEAKADADADVVIGEEVEVEAAVDIQNEDVAEARAEAAGQGQGQGQGRGQGQAQAQAQAQAPVEVEEPETHAREEAPAAEYDQVERRAQDVLDVEAEENAPPAGPRVGGGRRPKVESRYLKYAEQSTLGSSSYRARVESSRQRIARQKKETSKLLGGQWR